MRGVVVGPVADLPGEFWNGLFSGCCSVTPGGVVQRAWPDGLCLMEQEQFVVDAFDVMHKEVLVVISEQRKKQGHGKR